jgi:hypothetical protein
MSFVTMRSDLQPLCPVHRVPMAHCELWLKVDVDAFPKPCYACATPGCAYHYDVVSGYYTTNVGEHIERDMNFWQKCPHDGLPMHIAEFEPSNNKRTWKCGQIGCAGSRVTEGPLKASAASQSPASN